MTAAAVLFVIWLMTNLGFFSGRGRPHISGPDRIEVTREVQRFIPAMSNQGISHEKYCKKSLRGRSLYPSCKLNIA